MIRVIQRFVSELRRAGLPVSPAEAIDAARALRAVGLERRETVRLALRASLVKTHEDLPRFDRVFAAYFAAPREGGRRRGRGRREAAGQGGATRRRPSQEPGVGTPGATPRAPGPRRRPGRLRILREPRETRGAEPLAPRQGVPGRHLRPAGRPGARPEERRRPGGPGRTRRLDLAAPLTSADDERLAREVPRMIREIRLRAGRRARGAARGRPWMPRVMRGSLRTGGVPFVIPRRAPRPRRPRVAVLVDVSWSVARASALFLMLAGGFLKTRGRTTVHLFVDRCVDATQRLADWDGEGPASFSRFLETFDALDPKAASDYGRAFYQAARAHGTGARTSRRDTVLVVLGDARSNFRDPQGWAFEAMAGRSRRVIWLNPEPAARWDTGDSVLSCYAPSCDVICEARDLDGIARGVAAIVRAL